MNVQKIAKIIIYCSLGFIFTIIIATLILGAYLIPKIVEVIDKLINKI